MAGRQKVLGVETPMYKLFKRMFRLKKMLHPGLSLREISFGAEEINDTYSRTTYEGVLLGRRTGTKDMWEAIYQSMEFTPLEKMLINSTWMLRKLLEDIKKYGESAETNLYITEYAGMTVCFAYYVLSSDEQPEVQNIQPYYVLQGRLADVLVFFINQNKGAYVFEENELPENFTEYESLVSQIQSKQWDY